MTMTIGLVSWLAMVLAVIGVAGVVSFATAALALHRHKIPRPPCQCPECRPII